MLKQLTSLEIDSGPSRELTEPGHLEALPEQIGQLANLEMLTLRRNRLTALPTSFGKLTALETLLLTPTELVALPAAIGKLKRLHRFELLEVGKLERLPDELASCHALASVKIHGSQWDSHGLGNLEVLGRLPALRRISLRACRKIALESLLDALAGGPLEELDLGDTDITKIPAAIGKLGRLKKVWLERSNLVRLPSELRACSELQWIWVPVRSNAPNIVEDFKAQLPKGRWSKKKTISGTRVRARRCRLTSRDRGRMVRVERGESAGEGVAIEGLLDVDAPRRCEELARALAECSAGHEDRPLREAWCLFATTDRRGPCRSCAASSDRRGSRRTGRHCGFAEAPARHRPRPRFHVPAGAGATSRGGSVLHRRRARCDAEDARCSGHEPRGVATTTGGSVMRTMQPPEAGDANTIRPPAAVTIE